MLAWPKFKTPTPRRKGRYPKDYQSWFLWEVGLPLVAPMLVFGLLFAHWLSDGLGAANAADRALISVSGTGDLVIFTAFLLINVGSKFRVLSETEEPKDFVTDGELNGEPLFWLAFLFVAVYIGARVLLEAHAPEKVEVWKFYYGAGSLVVITAVVAWIDCKICKMHLEILKHKVSNGLISPYYNV